MVVRDDACKARVVGEVDAGGAMSWRAVNSCIQFVPMLDGVAKEL